MKNKKKCKKSRNLGQMQIKKEIENKFDNVGLRGEKEKELLRLQIGAMENEGNVPSQQGQITKNSIPPPPHLH